MFWGLLITAGAFEAEGLWGVLFADYPSRVFSLSAHALTVGVMVGLYAIHARKRNAEAAYDIGVQVGERLGRRTARPVIVPMPIPVILPPDLPPGPGKHVAQAMRQQLR